MSVASLPRAGVNDVATALRAGDDLCAGQPGFLDFSYRIEAGPRTTG
jgi:hypothetical protein